MLKANQIRLFLDGLQMGRVSEVNLRISMHEMLGTIHLMRTPHDENGKAVVDNYGKPIQVAESYFLKDIKFNDVHGRQVCDFELAKTDENIT